MKSILAFGDSLTWGFDPSPDGVRHDTDHRWPLVLESGLQGRARVHEEGLPGRTTCHDVGFLGHHNGLKALPMLLESHLPLDLVIIMLGTNDLQEHIGASAFNAARGVRRLIGCVRTTTFEQQTMRFPQMKQPKILIVSPPDMIASNGDIRRYFGDRSGQMAEIRSEYETVAQETGTPVFHAADVCKPSPLDGVHLSAPETKKLGAALVPVVNDILNLA